MKDFKFKYMAGLLVVAILFVFFVFKSKEIPDSPLQRLHTETLSSFEYVSDIENYGVEDLWAIDCFKGDCEDYALCIRDKLGKGDVLIVRATDGTMHAVLDVDGVIVDNLYPRVYDIDKMPHRLIARVLEGNPAYTNAIKN